MRDIYILGHRNSITPSGGARATSEGVKAIFYVFFLKSVDIHFYH